MAITSGSISVRRELETGLLRLAIGFLLRRGHRRAAIPNRSNRRQSFSFNKRLYKRRWRIENAFNRLKDFRRIATRYDKVARNYLASVCLAAAFVWWF